MPKVMLLFRTPEENQELAAAQQGMALSCAFWDLDNWLRDLSKYQDKTRVDISDVRSKIREVLTNHEITVVE
jgi:hypothetical protein